MQSIKNFFTNHKQAIFSIVFCLLILIVWQSNRSSWHATFVHLQRLYNHKILHQGQVNGYAVTARLDMAWHRQEHSLSCEIAALKMALSVYGLDIPESELISRLKFDPTPRSGGTWGDPYTGFVGNIDGRMGVSGYGVYWDPIAKVGNAYLRSEVFQASSQSLAQHISAGRPVVIWGYFGRGNRLSWTTPAGKRINAVNGEHARTVAGYVGDIESPEGFLVLDPIYGEEYWTTEALFNNWAPFENMGIVIYENPKWVKAYNDPTIWEISSDASVKYPLAMSWERFLEYGGVPDGVKLVSSQQLSQMNLGPTVR